MTNRLSGKRIFITGAAQGIGLAIAEASLIEGASVLLVDKDGDRLQESIKALGVDPKKVAWCEADITDEQSIKDSEAVLASFGFSEAEYSELIKSGAVHSAKDEK